MSLALASKRSHVFSEMGCLYSFKQQMHAPLCSLYNLGNFLLLGLNVNLTLESLPGIAIIPSADSRVRKTFLGGLAEILSQVCGVQVILQDMSSKANLYPLLQKY